MKTIRIYKRGDTYWMDYFARGERVRQSTKCQSRKDAQHYADSIVTASRMPTLEDAIDVLRRIYGEPSERKIPLEEAFGEYVRLAEAVGKLPREKATLNRRRQFLNRFSAWITKNRPRVEAVEDVDGAVAAAFAADLAKGDLKTKTRVNILGSLSTIWRMLEKTSPNLRNVWDGLLPRVTDAQRGQAFSPEQESAVLQAAKSVGKDWYNVCQVMRFTGLRYSDVARLEWSAIDGDVIRLTPNKTAAHGIAVIIPIIEPLRQVLDSIERRGDFVFPLHEDLYGMRGRAARSVLNFREVLDAAGITGEGYTIHSWRHTAATRLAEAGVAIETRKRILGHTEDATAERYDHAEHVREMREALEGAAGMH